MRKERGTIESRDHEESKGGVENNPGETVIQDPGEELYNTDYVVMYCIHEYLLVTIVQIQYSVRYIQTQVSIVRSTYVYSPYGEVTRRIGPRQDRMLPYVRHVDFRGKVGRAVA